MPETFQGIAVVSVALLPGALYVWSFERLVGSWGVGLSDRVFRFIGVSSLFHVTFLPVTYWLWDAYLRSGRLSAGDVPFVLWLAPLAYVGFPVAVGTLVGLGTLNRSDWAGVFTGPAPAPRAWDNLFFGKPEGWIRLRLNSGAWLGGGYAEAESGMKSYAAGYPEDPDLLLAEAVETDPDTGEFMFDDEGDPILRGSALLVRWEEVEYLEFIDV